MNDLRRELAPIPAEAWAEIDGEAKRALTVALAARKLVDFDGPKGWEKSAIGLGRIDPLQDHPADGVSAALRRVQRLVEFRAGFELSWKELDTIARGAKDPDLRAVTTAACNIALAEDRAIFHGYAPAGIVGINEAAADAALPITEEYQKYPDAVAGALARLKSAGVAGPYAIALGPRCYTGLTQTTVGGFPVIQHVQRLLDGPIVWAPAVDGAVVLSQRGGDFELTVGRDLSIGYAGHSKTTIELYIEESFTFRVLAPEAAVPLVYQDSKKR